MQEVFSKADDLNERIAKDSKTQNKQESLKFESEVKDVNLGKKSLSQYSLIAIETEYKKPKDEIDYDLLVRVTANL
jgi:hypothetical protein